MKSNNTSNGKVVKVLANALPSSFIFPPIPLMSSLPISIPITPVVQPFLPAFHTTLDISESSRTIHLSLRIRLLGRVVVASLGFLRRSVRLRVLARNLRLAGFLRIGRHVTGWRRCLVCSASGYAGEGTESERREALLGEGGAVEGHDGCLGDEWGPHLWWRVLRFDGENLFGFGG